MARLLVSLLLLSTLAIRASVVWLLVLLGHFYFGDPVASFLWFSWAVLIATVDGMLLSVVFRPALRSLGFA